MQIDTEEDVLVLEQLVDQKMLVVFNDDVNSFDHVTASLIKVCKHESIQAEQCTWIIHNNGKCDVKRGDFEALEPMCVALLDRGISAEIH
jgi:ATP-dependent Clp protease adaptor protein ClpS